MIDAFIAVMILAGLAVLSGCAYALFVPPVDPQLPHRDWPRDDDE